MTDISSKFRTLVVSDPKWESDGLRSVTVYSECLQGRGDVTLFVPPQLVGAKDPPLAILLHGVFGSHWNWAYRGGLHITALRMIQEERIPPMVIAMPSDGLRGDGSGYLPHPKADFERWIVDDIPNLAREIVPEITASSSMFIGGLSMGGFGALRLGAKYGNRFKAISAHSSVTSLDRLSAFVAEPIVIHHYAADEVRLIDVLANYRDQLPPLRFDCGLEDGLLADNQQLHQALLKAEIPHTYEEYSGDHDWDYWTIHVKKTLQFFGDHTQ